MVKKAMEAGADGAAVEEVWRYYDVAGAGLWDAKALRAFLEVSSRAGGAGWLQEGGGG